MLFTPLQIRPNVCLCRGEAWPALNKVLGVHFSPLVHIIHQLANFLKVIGLALIVLSHHFFLFALHSAVRYNRNTTLTQNGSSTMARSIFKGVDSRDASIFCMMLVDPPPKRAPFLQG